MALPSTMRRFRLEISDVDRGVYTTVEERVAQHPSETPEYLVARVLAFALEHEPGLGFGRGISTPEDPTLAVTDLQGRIIHWIEVGAPSADRLHKAAKEVERVTVYTHKRADLVLAELGRRPIHRAEEILVHAFPETLIAPLVARLDRKNDWAVLRTEGTLFVTVADATVEGLLETHRVQGGR